ncbi:hypothetical protein HanIR_Chr14g0699441 [Helianthus annuus]|nr:hypothetical protein HanIR_Chr14g0699441 [Helianthus annuus]
MLETLWQSFATGIESLQMKSPMHVFIGQPFRTKQFTRNGHLHFVRNGLSYMISQFSRISCPDLSNLIQDFIQDEVDRHMHQQTPPWMLTKSSVSSLRYVTSSVFISILALFKAFSIIS